MKPMLEPPYPDDPAQTIHAFWRREKHFPRSWHQHPEIELTYIQKGSGIRLVGDHSARYHGGELVLLGSGLPHTWFNESGHEGPMQSAVVIQFRPQVFPASLRQLPEFQGLTPLLEQAGRGLLFNPATVQPWHGALEELPNLTGLARWSALARVLTVLSEADAQPLASTAWVKPKQADMLSRIDRVRAYITQHCHEPLHQKQAAKVAGLSPSAFSRFFHRMTHQSFSEFRNECRIQRAAQMLIETELSITEIAYACGFNNLSNFNRQFLARKLAPPRDYRRLYQPSS